MASLLEYNHLKKAFENEFAKCSVSIDRSIADHSTVITVSDESLGVYHSSRVDELSAFSLYKNKDDYILANLKDLAKKVEYYRKDNGIHPITGDKYFSGGIVGGPAHSIIKGGTILDDDWNYPYDTSIKINHVKKRNLEVNDSQINERKKLKNYGRY